MKEGFLNSGGVFWSDTGSVGISVSGPGLAKLGPVGGAFTCCQSFWLGTDIGRAHVPCPPIQWPLLGYLIMEVDIMSVVLTL